MEKQRKSKNKILKFLLPKPASAVSFQFSPGRDKRSENHFHSLKAHVDKGFSGPIVSIIPDEVRRKPKNGNVESEEPTSPKVSCMGQIKLKKKMVISKAKRALPQETKAVPSPRKINKHASTIKKLFSSAKPTDRRRSNASIYEKQPLSERAPALSRDTFASIDWTDHISPVDSDHRGYYSDGEEEEEVIIPFSAPIIIGPAVALQPRKEVNLWKRRAMNPPRPLQLNLIRAI